MLRGISAPPRMRPFVAFSARERLHSTAALHRVRHRTDRHAMFVHSVSIALDHRGGIGCQQSGCALDVYRYASGESGGQAWLNGSQRLSLCIHTRVSRSVMT